MDILASMHALGHEQVLLSHDPSCGYFGIIAIHDTTLGPALGGTRFWKYATDEEAITDALRLARGMTYKYAVAGLEPRRRQVGHHRRQQAAGPRDALPRARPLHRDARRPLHHGRGRRHQHGGHGVRPAGDGPRGRPRSAGRGDPSPVTAYGVFVGMKASAKARWGSDSLDGQDGRGAGLRPRRLLPLPAASRGGRKLVVTDIDAENVKRVVRSSARGRWRRTRSTTSRPTFSRRARSAPSSTTRRSRSSRWRSWPAREQPVARGPARRRAGAAQHLYAPDYVQRRRRDQRVQRAHRWPGPRARRKGGEIYDTCSRSSRSRRPRRSRPISRPIASPSSASRPSEGWCGRGRE